MGRRMQLIVGGSEPTSPSSRPAARPAPSVVVMELADSSVNFAVRPWVKTKDWWAARCAISRSASWTTRSFSSGANVQVE